MFLGLLMISNRLSNVKPSITVGLVAKVKELSASGIDIVNLGIGEPDFHTPEHIKNAGIEAIRSNKTKYTPSLGNNALRDAVVAKLERDNDLIYNRDNVIISAGAKMVIYCLFMTTLNPGDEVIIPAPYWVSYPDIVTIVGGKPVVVNCGSDLKLTPDLLEKNITPKTKWVVINSPNNPSGEVYSKEELEAIAEVLKRHDGIHVVSDDIYEHILYDEARFFNIAQVEPALKDRVFIVNGVSKVYSMTGWRIGYGVGNRDIISAMAKVNSQSISNPCSISQEASLCALEGDHGFVLERNNSFKTRRNFIVDSLNAMRGISCRMPSGAFYAFPSCKGLFGSRRPDGRKIENDLDFVDYLISEAMVAVVPGSGFGYNGHFRVSYATELSSLEKARTNISNALDKLS